jgi:hypothetical protein
MAVHANDLSHLIYLFCRNAILKRFQMRKDLLQRVQRIKKPMDQMLKHPVLFLR